MCLAPQRPTFGEHFNFQKCSEDVLYILTWKCVVTPELRALTFQLPKIGPRMVGFIHFDLEMCFAPQRRPIFSSLIWPDGSAPAALARLLFHPPEPQIIGKNIVNRDFSTFLRTCIFFLLTLSLLWSSHSFFSSLNLPTSNFPSVHIVGSLTFKLP